ncbi:MAG: glycosyltransferase [Gemmataceae bacterium]
MTPRLQGRVMLVDHNEQDPIMVVIPVFNDWHAVDLLLRKLDTVCPEVHVLLVDDASTEPPPPGFLQSERRQTQTNRVRHLHASEDSFSETVAVATVTTESSFRSITKVQILELRRNLGHQRAIAIGLAYLNANALYRAVLVMDGDGEDDPRDVARLIERFDAEQGKKVIFARRSERSESLAFRFFYSIYRILHQLLTGRGINVGNFSILPVQAVDRLVAVTELWNHYASAVVKARLPHDSIPTKRGARLAGQPRMNFVSLVIHGLSSIAAYADVVGVRLLIASMGVIALTLMGIASVIAIKMGFAPEGVFAIPGWATNAIGMLLIILFLVFMLSIQFIFITLSNRQSAHFLPVRDYSYFVLRTRRIL